MVDEDDERTPEVSSSAPSRSPSPGIPKPGVNDKAESSDSAKKETKKQESASSSASRSPKKDAKKKEDKRKKAKKRDRSSSSSREKDKKKGKKKKKKKDRSRSCEKSRSVLRKKPRSESRKRKRSRSHSRKKDRSRSRKRKRSKSKSRSRKKRSRSRKRRRSSSTSQPKFRIGFEQASSLNLSSLLPDGGGAMLRAQQQLNIGGVSQAGLNGGLPSVGGPRGEPNPEVEAFLINNPVDPHAATTLRGLPKHLQRAVLSAGTLAGARDGSAVLLSRVRAATSGELKPPPPDVLFPGHPNAPPPPPRPGQLWNAPPLPAAQQAKLDMLRMAQPNNSVSIGQPQPILGVMPPSQLSIANVSTPTAGIGAPVGGSIGVGPPGGGPIGAGPIGAPIGSNINNSGIIAMTHGRPVPIIRPDGTVFHQ